MTDEELVRAYREGDALAFERLLDRHLSPVYSYLRRFAPADADDLAQETFVKAWRKLPSFDAGRSFKAWLYAIARRTAIDWSRTRKAALFAELSESGSLEEMLPDAEPLPDEALASAERADDVRRAITALPARDRELVLLRHEAELTFAEIGKSVGEPMNTVKSRYRRAVATLRKLLA